MNTNVIFKVTQLAIGCAVGASAQYYTMRYLSRNDEKIMFDNNNSKMEDIMVGLGRFGIAMTIGMICAGATIDTLSGGELFMGTLSKHILD